MFYDFSKSSYILRRDCTVPETNTVCFPLEVTWVQLARVLRVPEHFKNIVLLDIFKWQLDFIISSLHKACDVSIFFVFIESAWETLFRVPRSLEQPKILPMQKSLSTVVLQVLVQFFKLVYSLF